MADLNGTMSDDDENPSGSLDASNVPLLEDNNWNTWYPRMCLELGKHDATHLIDEVPSKDAHGTPVLSPKEKVQQCRLIGMIGGRLSDGYLPFTVGISTVHELMKDLKAECGENGWETESILFTKLCRVKYDPDEGTSAYIREFRNAVQQLQDTGRKLDNWITVYLFLAGLGEEHSAWATRVRRSSRNNPNPPQLNTLTSQLLDARF